jgi:hypothetical protein
MPDEDAPQKARGTATWGSTVDGAVNKCNLSLRVEPWGLSAHGLSASARPLPQCGCQQVLPSIRGIMRVGRKR